MIQCYYGDGKGKTTAAIGQALRMAGAGKKVIVIQFLKDGNSSENIMLKKCGIKVLAKKMPEMFIDMSDSKMIKEVSEQVNNLFSMIDENCDGIILDELLDALEKGIITKKEFELAHSVCAELAKEIMENRNAFVNMNKKEIISHI